MNVVQEMLPDGKSLAETLADLGVDQVPGTADLREQEPSERPEMIGEPLGVPPRSGLDPFSSPQLLDGGPLEFFAVALADGDASTAPGTLNEDLGHVGSHELSLSCKVS
jgi:hypothetical protein